MTLIETMLVLMIGVLVIAGVVVLAQAVRANMKVNRSKQTLILIEDSVQTMYAKHGTTPT